MALMPTNEELYVRLRTLVQEMPDFLAYQIPAKDLYRWIGKVSAVIEPRANVTTMATFRTAVQHLYGPLHDSHARTILAIIYEALAQLELMAPASYHGSFIATGNPHEAFAAVGEVLREANDNVLIVDPYADETLLSEYAGQVKQHVTVRVLAKNGQKNMLGVAAQKWAEQWGSDRPLEVRLVPAKSLHDRLIIVDGKNVWDVGQSFNQLAVHSPTSLSKEHVPELLKEKLAAFEELWKNATPM